MARRKLIAGNWKMNGVCADLDQAVELAGALAAEPSAARVALCRAATPYLYGALDLLHHPTPWPLRR